MKIYRSFFGKMMDFITFPIRIGFMLEKGKFGLCSTMEERMIAIKSFCKGKVLDIGCGRGNIFINNYIGKEGIGIDCFPYEGIGLFVKDMRKLPFEDNSFDTITLNGVAGHIPKSLRTDEFKEFTRVLKPNGLLVMDEGYLISQNLIHAWSRFLYGSNDSDAIRGEKKEGEEYAMPEDELLSYLNTKPLKVIKKKILWTQWGFKYVYVAQKDPESLNDVNL